MNHNGSAAEFSLKAHSVLEQTKRTGGHVGAIVRLKRFFTSPLGFVLEDHGDGQLVVLMGNGLTQEVAIDRLASVVSAPDPQLAAGSIVGRYLQFLSSPSTAAFRNPAIETYLRRQVSLLLAERQHALGLLLDLKLLGLSLEECEQLPVEKWRVRYEYLRQEPELPESERRALAARVVSDDEAPIELRVAVAMSVSPSEAAHFLLGDDSASRDWGSQFSDALHALRRELTGSGHESLLMGEEFQSILGHLRDPKAAAASENLLADRSVWEVLLQSGVQGDPKAGPHSAEYFSLASLREAEAAMWRWQWADARVLARDALREARAEILRDELLNIIACSLWMEGEHEPALAALDRALEGEYTEALLINASIVASELEHDSAKSRLIRLAQEAPNPDQRALAAERALILWDNEDARIWEESEGESLPIEIRDALRPLIGHEISEDRYLRVLRVLASRDSKWLAEQRDDAFGPNVHSTAARVMRARARGIEDFISELSRQLNSNGGAPVWVGVERDNIIEAATQVLLERIDELPAAFFGLTVLNAKLPMTTPQHITLTALTVGSIASGVDDPTSEPQERFVDLLVGAQKEWASLDEEPKRTLAQLLEFASSQLAICYLNSRRVMLRQLEGPYTQVCIQVAQIRLGGARVNMAKVKEAMSPMASFCRESVGILRKLRNLPVESRIGDALDGLIESFSEWWRKTSAPTESSLADDASQAIRRFGGFGGQ